MIKSATVTIIVKTPKTDSSTADKQLSVGIKQRRAK
jgi:hypothetical protein